MLRIKDASQIKAELKLRSAFAKRWFVKIEYAFKFCNWILTMTAITYVAQKTHGEAYIMFIGASFILGFLIALPVIMFCVPIEIIDGSEHISIRVAIIYGMILPLIMAICLGSMLKGIVQAIIIAQHSGS